jgi:hypothetical protein
MFDYLESDPDLVKERNDQIVRDGAAPAPQGAAAQEQWTRGTARMMLLER